MKYKYFLLSTLIFLIVLSSVGNGYSYSMNAKEDKLYIWEIKSFDEDLAFDVFGIDDVEDFYGFGAEVGAMIAYEITDIYNDIFDFDEFWVVEFDIWNWTTDIDYFSESPDYEGLELYVFKEPQNTSLTGWIIGVPIDSYLANINWSDSPYYDSVDVKSNGYTGDSTAFDAYTSVEYDFNGVWKSTTYLDSDKDVITEVVRYSDDDDEKEKGFWEKLFENIPGFPIELLLIISLISTGIIALKFKKHIKD